MKISGLNTWKPSPLIRWVRAAPIFDIADYDIVGDLFEAVPMRTEEIKKSKGLGRSDRLHWVSRNLGDTRPDHRRALLKTQFYFEAASAGAVV